MRPDAIWRGETRELDDAARRSAAGAFVPLSRGYTHYELGTPDRAPSIILIHGFSVPYFIWDPTFEALLAAGMNPLRYDLYGRGFSDRPRAEYGVEFFERQVLELLGALGAQAVDIVGLSMGGVIAAAFTAHNPARVRKLILIDPSGARTLPWHPLYAVARLPVIGELAFGLAGTGSLVSGIASDFYDAEQVASFQARYRTQMELRGFKRSILSTIRNRMLGEFAGLYRTLGQLDTPVMLIWGQNDRTVPFDQSRALLELIPRAVFHPIPACGHIPHYEKPALVNPLLISFVQG